MKAYDNQVDDVSATVEEEPIQFLSPQPSTDPAE